MISTSTLEKINEAARIEDVVGDFLTLKRAGAGLTACCPFHSEKTPSFHVHPARGLWKCFGCGRGGDTIGFLRENGMQFEEAVNWLSKKYSIQIERTAEKPDPDFDEKTRIRATMAATIAHLTRDEENPGASFWSRRGFDPETIATFGLGFAQDGTVPHIARASLIEAGIANAETGNLSTFGRAVIPIHDRMGNPVSLSGRLIKDAPDSPKYINGRETPAYKKAATLFNLHRAAPHIHRAGEAWIVEGYADVMALWQAGVRNAVGLCGTALTDEQAALLRRFNGDKNLRFFLALDNETEKGGTLKPEVLKAYHTALEKLLPIGEVRKVKYPNHRTKDLCDWVMGGKFDIEAAKGRTEDALENFVSETWTEEFGKSASAVEKAEQQERLAALLARVKKDSVRDIYIKSLSVTVQTTPRKMEEMVKGFGEKSAPATNRSLEKFDYIKVKDTYLRRLPDIDPDTKAVVWRYTRRVKDEIKQEFGTAFLNNIPRFDNYIFSPSHTTYKRIVDMHIEGTHYRFFNQYEPLDYPEKPFDIPPGFSADPENFDYTTIQEIANTARLFAHLFRGENRFGRKFLTYAWDYLALLYLRPTQRLPALALVSQEEGTGKSTYLNLLGKIFGQNAVKNDAGRIGQNFNSLTSGKLLVFVEETADESRALENTLKDLITATERVVEAKHQDARTERTIAKFVFASNHEDSFLKVGTETTRFFVAKIAAIEAKDPNFEEKLFLEIPYLLHFLTKRGVLTEKKDRLWFAPPELENEALLKLRQASKDVVQQNLEALFQALFLQTEYDEPILKISTEYVKKLMTAYAGRLYEQKTPNYFQKVMADQLRLKQSNSPAKFRMPILEAVEKMQDLAVLEHWDYIERYINGRYFSIPIWRFVSPEDFAQNYSRHRAELLIYHLHQSLRKDPDAKAAEWLEAAEKLTKAI